MRNFFEIGKFYGLNYHIRDINRRFKVLALTGFKKVAEVYYNTVYNNIHGIYNIPSNLTLGNRNFDPKVTFVQKLYDWDRLSKRIKNLCRATKFVHVIGCQGENKFLGILKK